MLDSQGVSIEVAHGGDNFFLKAALSNTTPPNAYSINLITLDV